MSKWIKVIAVSGCLAFSGAQAVAIGFSDADAAAYLDLANTTFDFESVPGAPPPGPFGPFPDFDTFNHFDQGVFTTTWDGHSTFVDDDDDTFSTTSWPHSVHALSHSDSPFAPVSADAAADATDAGISALTSVGFDTEGSAHAFRDLGGTFAEDGSVNIVVPYEISYGTIPFLPDDVSVFTQVIFTATVWDDDLNPYEYWAYDYFWHTSILGDSGSFTGDFSIENVEFFDGETFLLTYDAYTVIVIDDDDPAWDYPPLLEDLINGDAPDTGFAQGDPGVTRHGIPEPASAALMLTLIPLIGRRLKR